MRNLVRSICKWFKGESGLTSAEYAVAFALVIVMTIAALTMLGGKSPRSPKHPQAVTTTK